MAAGSAPTVTLTARRGIGRTIGEEGERGAVFGMVGGGTKTKLGVPPTLCRARFRSSTSFRLWADLAGLRPSPPLGGLAQRTDASRMTKGS
jgi:hypothetical protein